MNATIYHCFELVSEQDGVQFVRKFGEQPHNDTQIMHTFRELVIGAYMGSQGLRVHSEPKIDGKTPDWLIEPDAILELVNFHVPQAVENDIRSQFEAKGHAAFFMQPNTDRLYDRLWEKARAYVSLAQMRPYVVAVFADIDVEIEDDEIDECLSGEHGLFVMCPWLSGVVHFIERGAVYYFRYFANPHAVNPYAFPKGILDLRLNLSAFA